MTGKSESSFDPRAVGDSFRRAWTAGEGPLIEDVLTESPEDRREELLDVLIPIEWHLRGLDGETLNAQFFAKRFDLDPAHISKLVADSPQPEEGDHAHVRTDQTTAFAGEAGTFGTFAGKKTGKVSGRLSSGGVPSGQALINKCIGRYRVVRLLGHGGFGVVYLGEDQELQREVAIKLPRPRGQLQPQAVERYLAEARTVAGLDHPNIVPVFDVGHTQDIDVYTVSKLVAGVDLAQRIKTGGVSRTEAVELVAKIAEALAHAHTQKVIHRDVKPSNILVDEQGEPHLTDFGLALTDGTMGFGTSGTMGTPAYMSPEQARGESHLVDGRSDIFSLGVVLYELLCGERPFSSPQRSEQIRRIIYEAPKPPRQLVPSVPAELERICLKALEKRASARYATATEMAEDLRL